MGEGDFRTKLQKAKKTKIDTTAAFPQAKAKVEQIDFRNVLKKKVTTEKKVYASGSRAQTDFRGSLKKQEVISCAAHAGSSEAHKGWSGYKSDTV